MALYKCVFCDLELAEDDLWVHLPKAHGDLPNSRQTCPICAKSKEIFVVHFHEKHGPLGRIARARPEDYSILRPTLTFAMVLCQHPDGRFLIIEETAQWGWWLPAGSVDPGETLMQGAIREAKEEAGIDVELKGLLRFEYYPDELGGGRQRAIFYAVPKDPNQRPKSEPDYESRGAKWATFEEIVALLDEDHLRGPEPHVWTKYILEGQIFPLEVIDIVKIPYDETY